MCLRVDVLKQNKAIAEGVQNCGKQCETHSGVTEIWGARSGGLGHSCCLFRGSVGFGRTREPQGDRQPWGRGPGILSLGQQLSCPQAEALSRSLSLSLSLSPSALGRVCRLCPHSRLFPPGCLVWGSRGKPPTPCPPHAPVLAWPLWP